MDEQKFEMIMEMLSGIKSDVASSEERLSIGIEKCNAKISIQNGRIGKLENWRAYLIGIFTVIASIVTYVVHYLFG